MFHLGVDVEFLGALTPPEQSIIDLLFWKSFDPTIPKLLAAHALSGSDFKVDFDAAIRLARFIILSDMQTEGIMAIPESGTETDGAIVRRVLAGQSEEYERLVRKYLRVVKGQLRTRLRLAGHILDEAVQDAFVTTYEHLQELRDPDRFAGFLLKIAIRRPRSKKGDVGIAEYGTQHDASIDPDKSRESWKENLREAIGRLPEHMQLILALKFGTGFTAEEIAGRLGQSVGSVTKTLSRAYEQLRTEPDLKPWSTGRDSE